MAESKNTLTMAPECAADLAALQAERAAALVLLETATDEAAPGLLEQIRAWSLLIALRKAAPLVPRLPMTGRVLMIHCDKLGDADLSFSLETHEWSVLPPREPSPLEELAEKGYVVQYKGRSHIVTNIKHAHNLEYAYIHIDREDHCAVSHNGALYAIGGYATNKQGSDIDDIMKLTDDGWATIVHLPSAETWPYAASDGQYIWIMYNDPFVVYKFDPITAMYALEEIRTDLAIAPMNIHCCAGRLVFPGAVDDIAIVLIYDPATKTAQEFIHPDNANGGNMRSQLVQPA